LAVVSTVAFTPFRASHSALMPSLCRTPDELAAVNVARGALDSVSVIVGPLVAALLLAVADVAAVFVFSGACSLGAAVLLVRLAYERVAQPSTRPRNLGAEVREGVAAVAGTGGVAVVVGLVVLQAAIRGAFTVLILVVALDLLDRPDASVGVLQSAVGIGAVAGSLLCTLLVGSRAMTRWLGVAVVLWGAPLALIGAVPHYLVALLAAGVIGIGNALVDVTAFTLIARMVPDAVLARVFGVLESVGALAVGVGSLLAPLLIGLLGTQGALLAVGAVAPVVCLLAWSRLTEIDHSVAVRTDDIVLLRRVPMLHPLPAPVIEQLGRDLHRTTVGAGETVFEAGDPGDGFYVIADGTVEVIDQDRIVRRMSTGEGFGEIALLGRVTRTMTVRARGSVELCVISGPAFLSAVTSISGARAAAEEARWAHLARAPGSGAEEPGPP
jgi:MFS family permease